MLAVVIQIDGWDPVAGGAVTLRAGSHDDAAVCHLDGQTWWPALLKLPALSYDFFDGSFAGQIAAPAASLSCATAPWPLFGRYTLADARFRLWTGELGANWSGYTLRFDGRVSGQPKASNGRAEVSFAVDDRWLDAPLLATYAGTTGAEGAAALKGQVKPLALGAPRYVPGVLIDPVNSVFQVSAYGAIVGFQAALEKLARFGAPVGDYPTYAALVAATIPPGRWATANAVGMARLGAPPVGQVSFLVQGDAAGPNGWARKPGQIIRRLALLSGGAGKVNDALLDAIDAARPYNLSLYLDQQTTARALIQDIAASVNAVAGVSWLGKLFVLPVGVGAPTLTLATDGTALPPVQSVEQIEVAAPWKRLAIKAERSWTVHQLGDIAFTAPLQERGRYDAASVYREGDIVDLGDGSRWLYVATDPGSTPPPGEAWSSLSPATRAEDIAYADGTPIEYLKPAEPGATNSADPASPFGPGQTVGGTLLEQQARALAQLRGTAAAELARIRTRALAFSGPDGASVDTLVRREENRRVDGDTAIVETIDLIGARSGDGQAFIVGAKALVARSGEAGATRYDAIGAVLDEQGGRIEDVRQVLATDEGTLARAILQLDVAGRIVGVTTTNTGTTSGMVIVIDAFTLETPAGVKLLYADGTDGGRVKMPNVEVDTLKIDTVTGREMAQGSAQKTAWGSLAGDVVVPQGATVTIFETVFVKEDNDSALKVQTFLNLKSGDDLQCDVSIQCDGMVMAQAQRINLVLDNSGSQAQAPLTPFTYITGIIAGPRTITVKVYNRETDAVSLSVVAGSALEIAEMRKAAIGSITGSGAALPPPGSGGSGSGVGGEYNGNYKQHLEQQQ